MDERTVRINEAETSVELTAVDLVALSVTDAFGEPHEDESARSTSSGRKALLKIALPAGLLLAAVAAGGALYTRDAAKEAAQRVAVAAPAPAVIPDVVVEPASPTEPEPVPEPLRYRNPFDKAEVFEFPAGTTKAEARDAVAQILLERATERRAADPKLRKKYVHK